MFRIPLTKPHVPASSRAAVLRVLDSGFLTEGPVARQIEALACDYIGCRRSLVVCNCTVGLELALRALGIGRGDEVIVPDYTYPATADAVSVVGATPVIVDINPDTLLIDYDGVEKALTDKTKAVMPVSEFGNPLDHERLDAIKRRHGIYVIEDAACALGSSYHGKRTGNLADISVFSLHPRKFITSGEGGIITTNNGAWADFMDSHKHFGMRAEGGALTPSFERMGTNYKLSDVLCAVALGQFEMIDDLLARRMHLAERYRTLLAGVPGVTIPTVTAGGIHSYQTFSVLTENRDRIMPLLRGKGIEVQVGTYALHREPAFREEGEARHVGPFPHSLRAYHNNLSLPLYYGMDEAQQDEVVSELLAVCSESTG